MPGVTQLEKIFLIKDLRVPVDTKLNLCRICVSNCHEKTNGCIRHSITSRWREVILPIYSSQVRPNVEYCVQIWNCH